MKYDDASWHSSGDFPEGSPEEYGGTHIGLLLKWCFLKGWAGRLHLDEWPDDVARVLRGEMSGTDFLFSNCDGKFTKEDLNDEGNHFISYYIGENGPYLDDYGSNFSDKMYTAPEEEHDFKRFAAIADARYATFLSSAAKADKPWWNFWS